MYNILNGTNILTSARGFGISLCFLCCKEISFDRSLKNALPSRFLLDSVGTELNFSERKSVR